MYLVIRDLDGVVGNLQKPEESIRSDSWIEIVQLGRNRLGNRILDWQGIIDAAQPRPQGSVRRRAELPHQPSRAARRGDNRGLGS